MRKRIIAAVALAGIAALGLAGCSGTASGSGGDKATITYTNFISQGGNEKNLAKIVSAFEKKNPDITVKVKTMAYADYFTALQTDLAAGTQSDVFDIEYANYKAYQQDGVLAPLKGVDTGVYRKSLIDAYSTDGTVYGLPTSFSNVVLYYNKDLFDKAGVSYPTSDWTWKDEQAAAEKLTDASAGVFGDYQPISYNEFYKAVAQAGGSFLSKDGKKATFDSDAGVAAAKWLTGKNGTTMPTAAQGAGTPDFDTKLFHDGKLAMEHTGIWVFGTFADGPANWDIAVEPGDTQKASALFSNAIVVSAQSKHQAAAQKWAEFMSSSKTMVDVRLDAGWELPPVSDDKELSSYLTKGSPKNRQAVFDSLDHVALAPSIGQNQQKMQDIVDKALGQIVTGADAAATLKAAAAQVDALLK